MSAHRYARKYRPSLWKRCCMDRHGNETTDLFVILFLPRFKQEFLSRERASFFNAAGAEGGRFLQITKYWLCAAVAQVGAANSVEPAERGNLWRSTRCCLVVFKKEEAFCLTLVCDKRWQHAPKSGRVKCSSVLRIAIHAG